MSAPAVRKISRFVKFISWIGIIPCVFVGGISAIITPAVLLRPDEDSTSNPHLLAAGSALTMVFFSTAACICIQIVGQRYWPTVDERRKNRRGVGLWILLGGVLVPLGFPLIAAGGVGALLVIGGAMLLGNGLAALLTGLPWRAVFNVFMKRTVGLAASELVQKINPIEFNIAGIDCKPELLEATPEYDRHGNLSVIRTTMPSEQHHAQPATQTNEHDLKEFLKRLERNS